MTRICLTLFVAVACVIFAWGCRSVQEDLGLNAEPSYIELTENQPGDIPVPKGFSMVTKTKESFSKDLGPGGYRDAHLVYTGDSSPRKVARFFEKSMVLPAYGWRDRTEYQNEGDRTLKFIKGRSVCTIVITETRIKDEVKTRIEFDILSKA